MVVNTFDAATVHITVAAIASVTGLIHLKPLAWTFHLIILTAETE